ncbi:hypothetical protein SAMN04487968_10968 [Nocardioides terrae]|uniref:Uncharacterized protein n=1 Tax=Nocardioides terrae TaxID=574651 RepID=A0A1I1L622_9ACTN|nr:hypothetical protein SAMN04487968_10968 [Nocardioides terrae]
MVHRLATAACGWPAGTELLVAPARRLQRGDVVVAEEGRRRLVGVYQVRFGRPFLLAAEGAVWLGAGVRVLGPVTVASPPLPDPDADYGVGALAERAIGGSAG